MDWQMMEVVLLIDPLGTHNFFLSTKETSLFLNWVYGGLTALISAGDTCFIIGSLYWYLFWISKSENNRLELYFT